MAVRQPPYEYSILYIWTGRWFAKWVEKGKSPHTYLVILRYNLPVIQFTTSTAGLDAGDDEIAPASAVLLSPLLGLALPDRFRGAQQSRACSQG